MHQVLIGQKKKPHVNSIHLLFSPTYVIKKNFKKYLNYFSLGIYCHFIAASESHY